MQRTSYQNLNRKSRPPKSKSKDLMILPTEAMLNNDIYDDNGDPLPKAEELIRILS